MNRICTRPPPNYLISKNSLPHPAFQTASQQDGALIVAPDSFFLAERARIAPLSKCLRESKVAPSASGRLNKSNKLLHLRARRMKNEHQGALLSSKKSSKSLSKSVTPCLKDSNEAREPWARPALASVPEPPPITRPSANSVDRSGLPLRSGHLGHARPLCAKSRHSPAPVRHRSSCAPNEGDERL